MGWTLLNKQIIKWSKNICFFYIRLQRAIKMFKLHRKTSRAAYQKAKKQKSDPKYLQQLLAKQTHLKMSDIQKSFEELDMSNAPQFEESTNVCQIVENKQIQQEIENNVKQSNVYFQMFKDNNQKLKANNKVERQKLRIEKQNYNEIVINSQKTLTDLTDKLYDLWANLENKYKQGHAYFQYITLKNQERRKKIKIKQPENQTVLKTDIQQIIEEINDQTSSIIEIQKPKQEIYAQNLKHQQNQIQIQIKSIQTRIKQELQCRKDFLLLLMSSGYYQQNGLIWILEQIAKIQESDHQRMIKILRKVDLTRGKEYYNPFQNQMLKLKIGYDNFPSILDTKSKKYMIQIFHGIKQHKQRAKIVSKSLKKSIKDQEQSQLEHSKVYIPDNQSSIFPHSGIKRQTPSLSQNPKQKSHHQVPLIMVRKTHENILQKSNITDIAKSMEVHMRPEKYNFDIKNIYANTKQSLEKWIKGMCKQVVKNKNSPPNKHYHKKSEEDSSLHLAGRVQTQISIPLSFVSSVHEKRSNKSELGQIKNQKSMSKIGKSNIKTTKQSNMMENRGFSLPLIKNKLDKILPKNDKTKYHKPKERSHLNQTANLLDDSTVNSSKIQSSQKECDDESRRQKIRILRIYPKENHQKVMKLLFGIKINMEQITKLLYQ